MESSMTRPGLSLAWAAVRLSVPHFGKSASDHICLDRTIVTHGGLLHSQCMDTLKMQPHQVAAISQLADMNQVESTLVEFERQARLEQDISLRHEQLVDLNRWYLQKFGGLFEARQSIRHRLLRQLMQETRPNSSATENADRNLNGSAF